MGKVEPAQQKTSMPGQKNLSLAMSRAGQGGGLGFQRAPVGNGQAPGGQPLSASLMGAGRPVPGMDRQQMAMNMLNRGG